jgi:hypothetical protein
MLGTRSLDHSISWLGFVTGFASAIGRHGSILLSFGTRHSTVQAFRPEGGCCEIARAIPRKIQKIGKLSESCPEGTLQGVPACRGTRQHHLGFAPSSLGKAGRLTYFRSQDALLFQRAPTNAPSQ